MISIIMPAYNASEFIVEAIESVLSQTFEVWELLIIDDGSTDETLDIARRYREKDERIRIIQNDHSGVSQARNTGLKEAKYPWIALLDSDDVYLPQRLQKQVDAIEQHPDVIVWGTYAYNIGISGERFGTVKDRPSSKAEFYEMRNAGEVIMIKNSSALFRLDHALELGGYDSKYDSAEDTEFWDRMAEHGPIKVIPEPLIEYRVHNNSLTAKKQAFQYTCTRYLHERNKARLMGEKLLFEDFLVTYNNRSALERWVDNRQMMARIAYRNANMKLVNKHRIEGGFWLIMALVNNPFMIIPRIWRKFMPL